MENNKAVQMTIMVVRASYAVCHDPQYSKFTITYTLDGTDRPYQAEQLFPTKEELLASL
jgi:hypothetical protein